MENIKESKIYITTDTHLGHRKMEQYCGRPENFDSLILHNLLVMLNPGDTLIHLGDICIGDDDAWHEELVRETWGVKRILVRGNHDKKSDNWYSAHGWDFVCENFSGIFFGNYITFSHRPIPNIQNKNIHGHFHNNLDRLLKGNYVVEGEKERNEKDLAGLNSNHRLLAIEYTKYKPVLLSTLCKKK